MKAITVAKDVITAATLLAGLLWTLYNFGLQRVRQPVVRLQVERGEVHKFANYASVSIRFAASNSGKTGVAQDMSWVEITTLSIPASHLNQVILSQPLADAETRTYSIFKLHTYLEPGEEFQDSLLLHIPPDAPFIMARMIFSANNPHRTWYAQTVISAIDDD